MDDALRKALDFAKYRQTYSIQQKVLKEKIDARLTYGHNGGIFKIDRPLIAFVQMLIDQGRTSGVPVLDLNENPILIDDLEKFRDEIFDRYFSSTLEYYEEYESLKKKRSVEKLIDYE
jgi:hypothetical protein